MEDIQELGGSIELIGFSPLDGGSMIVLKKMIGSYARRLSDNVEGFEKLKITLEIKEEPDTRIHNIKSEVTIKGEPLTAEAEDKNVFVAVDSCLKKSEQSLPS